MAMMEAYRMIIKQWRGTERGKTNTNVADVWPKIEAGELRPTIYKVLPMAQAEEAHAILERGENVGKVVLRVKNEG